MGGIVIPVFIGGVNPGTIASYQDYGEKQGIHLAEEDQVEVAKIGFQRLYNVGYRADGTPFQISGMTERPADFVSGYGGDTHDLAHEVGHAFETSVAPFDSDEWSAIMQDPRLGVFTKRGVEIHIPDVLGRGSWGTTTVKNPSEAAASAFADYIQVPGRMYPETRAWMQDQLTKNPKWNGIVSVLRAHPDPAYWKTRGAIRT
jgi:hypothetical protein